MPEHASLISCLVCEVHAACFAAACRYTSDPEYKSAMQTLARKEEILACKLKILAELLKEKNLLRSQGELLGPCCGTLTGNRATLNPKP